MLLSDMLWNDKDFVRKRALEQLEYISFVMERDISDKRKEELLSSAIPVFKKFESRLQELENKKCKCGRT